MKTENRFTQFVYDFASVIVTGMIVIAVVFTFFFRTAGVNGRSMLPTLSHNDMLLLSAQYRNPKQGDIVIITQPNAFNEPLVKRIIAVGGQTIDIDFDSGEVFVDGELLKEDYIKEPTMERENFEGPVTVPEGFVFVMGDNRNNSTDSRSALVGMIDVRYIYGKVEGRLFPTGDFKVY